MVIIGVDPGITGAAAALWCADRDGPEFIADVIDLPTLPDGTKRQLDGFVLSSWVQRMNPTRAIVENVRAMPALMAGGARRGMGSASSFRFGFVAGQIRGILQALQIPVQLVEPRVWKDFYSISKEKQAALEMARKLYPDAAHYLQRKKDDGRAEAMLIARYGERTGRGGNW